MKMKLKINNTEFVVLNPSTSIAEKYTEIYKKSNLKTIFDMYKNPSSAKQSAYNYNVNLCNNMDGKNFKILRGNCNTFSCGWLSEDSLLLFMSTRNGFYVIPKTIFLLEYVYEDYLCK